MGEEGEHRYESNPYPTMTAFFSISASSNGVIFATSGSGVQSSTSSSISYFHPTRNSLLMKWERSQRADFAAPELTSSDNVT